MKKILFLLSFLLAAPCYGQQITVVQPNPPCTAFGTASGTCAQGNDSRITGAGQLTAPACTPTLTSFTLVGAAPPASCTILKVGNAAGYINFLNVLISTGTGGNTSITAVGGTSSIDGLPVAAIGQGSSCPAAIDDVTDTTINAGGQVINTSMYPGTWSASTHAIVLSCTYQTAN